MPRGCTADEAQAHRKARLLETYNEHKRELRKLGIDPDWIGSHEIQPVCCGNCGHQIPWSILKGWAN